MSLYGNRRVRALKDCLLVIHQSRVASSLTELTFISKMLLDGDTFFLKSIFFFAITYGNQVIYKSKNFHI